MKNILVFCIAMLLCAGAQAELKQIDDSDTYWDTTGTAPNYTLIISGFGDMPNFTSSSVPWKNQRASIATVVVAEGVTSVGGYAFYGFSKLTSVSLPEDLASIGSRTFYGCSSLGSVTLPEGLTSMGELTFYDCTSLASVTLPEGLNSIPNYAFNNCSKLTSINWPASLTSIGISAFSNCSSLTSVILPASLNSMESTAFGRCSSLTSIILPKGLNSIPGYAFINCSSLTSVILPEGLNSIGSSVFENCSKLTSIILPASLNSIDASAFSGCSKLASITSLNSTPPGIYVANVFQNIAADCVLEIPTGSANAYRAAILQNRTGGWAWTKNIKQKTPQSIVWTQTLGTKTCEDAAIALSASTTPAGTRTITYTSNNPVVATVGGTSLPIVGAGQAIIVASQDGDNTYLAAQSVQKVITVVKTPQPITWAQAPALAAAYGGQAIELNASGGRSGNDIVYTSGTPEVGWISDGNMLNIGALGTSLITATQKGNSCYGIAIPVTTMLTVVQTLTIESLTVAPKVYDGNRVATVASVTLGEVTGIVDGDEVVVEVDSARFDNAGADENKTVVVYYKLSGRDSANYIKFNDTITTGKIVPDTLTISDVVVGDTVYNGSTTATATEVSFLGLVEPETLAMGINYTVGTAEFTTAGVGKNKEVTIEVSLVEGNNTAKNYVLASETYTGITTAKVTAASLTIDSVVVGDTVYNGTTTATVTEVRFSGLVEPETLALGTGYTVGTADFTTAIVGENKQVAISVSLVGNNNIAKNYVLASETYTGTTTAKITKRQLTIGASVEKTKIYNGNRVAIVALDKSTDTVAGDDVRVELDSALFDNAKVGDDKTVVVYYSLSGLDKDNYIKPDNDTLRACKIVKDTVVVTPNARQGKVYGDNEPMLNFAHTPLIAGNTLAPNTLIRELGDTVGTYAILDPGLDAGSNYFVKFVNDSVFTITKRPLSILSAKVTEKHKQGDNLDAEVTEVVFSGLVNNDSLRLDIDYSYTAFFSTSDVGSGKLVTVAITLQNTDRANNYKLEKDSAYAEGIIVLSKPTVTWPEVGEITYGMALDSAKFTDGAGNPSGKFTWAEGTTVPHFADSSLTPYLMIFTPDDRVSYDTLLQVATVAVHRKPLTIEASMEAPKIYNGDRVATVALTLTGNVAGDEIRVEVDSARFADANVGNNKTVTVYYQLSGSDSANYTASGNLTITDSIVPKTLTISTPEVGDTIYNGTNVARITSPGIVGADDIVGDDNVEVAVDSVRFDDADAGDNKTVTVYYSLSGLDKDNYTAPDNSIITTGKIAKDTVVVTPNACQGKVYGDEELVLTYSTDLANLIEGNSFGGALSRNDANNHNVGTYAITQGDLNAGNNYFVNFVTDSVFTITKRPISVVGATVAEKHKQGDNLEATLTEIVFDNLATDDSLKLGTDYSYTALFEDADVGTGKPVSVTITLQNTDLANNYKFEEGANTTDAEGVITLSRPTVTWPTVSEITYGMALDSAKFTDWENEPSGSFAWAAGTTVPGVADSLQLMIFTPDDGASYDTLQHIATVVVHRKQLTVTPDEGQNKVQGDDDPVLTYSADYDSLIGDDTLTGELSRVLGETAKTYAILQGSLSAGNNYAINFVGGRVFTIKRPLASQTLEYQASHFFATLEKAMQAMPIKLSDTTNCGLPVRYTSSDTSVAIIVGDSVLMVTGAGSAIITATNDGNSSYSPLNVKIYVNVGDRTKQYQEITWNQTLTRAVGDTVVLTAKAGSGLPIRYISSNTLVAIIVNDSVLVVVGAGSAEITASQPGNDDWNPALKVVPTYATVSDPDLKSQSILWNQTLDYSLNDQEVMLTAKATSGLPVRYTSDNLNVAMVVGNKLVFIDAGQAIITAIQEGNDIINPAPVEQLVLTVRDPGKQNQTIVWNQTLNTTYDGNNLGVPNYITLNATVGSGLGIVYRSSNTDIALIVNKEVIIKGPGQAIITATQPGDATYNPAPAVQQVITVSDLNNKRDQTIDWEQILESGDADDPNTIVLDASASSGLPIRYISSNTKVATIEDGVLTIEGRGLAIITATQPGNDNYNPAPVATQVLNTADYTFDTCVTTMYCNFFMLRLRTLRTVLNVNNQTLGLDSVIILHARWFLNEVELTEGVTPAGEFIAGYSYSAGKKAGARLADGIYHFVLSVREVYTDGTTKELDIRSGDRIVAGCSTMGSTKLLVYPNPSVGSRSIFVRAALDASPRADNTVRIYSVSNGALVKEVPRLSETTEITLPVAPGNYSVQTGGEQVKIMVGE